MSLSITFYNDIKYTKDDFMNRDRDFFGNGVVQVDDFALQFPEVVDGTFRVGRGVAWVDGYRIANDSDGVQLEFQVADSQARIDIVQIGHDDLKSQAALTVKKGVPADEPIEPGPDYGYIKLYAIQVPANATGFDASNVEDRRELVSLNVSGSQINFAGAVKATSLGQAGGVATLGADGKVPTEQLPPLDYIPIEAEGKANGVATLGTDGKLSSTQLPVLNYIPTSAKGQANGVATLGSSGVVPSSQLPIAGTSLGGVKKGTGITIATDGTISVLGTTARTDVAQTWTATQTFSGALTLNGTVTGTALGAANGIATLDVNKQVPASQLGNVPPVNAATTTTVGTVQMASPTDSGNPVAASRSTSASEMQINTTNATQVVMHTPVSQTNYMVLASLRVITAATNVTLTVAWTDATGTQVDTRISNQSLSVGTHDVPIKFINAVSDSPITVTVTAGTANQVYASAAIVGV